ncbi:hypothetical protein [Paracerasibacillus soli]|uniref:Uncharacterized protein n=2 Tax=Paracerasibacillus soli TaxID=480284 RepID=A0ABU5CQ73_9BACI|nr:hypothetical protein [Virgibacillus soli]MDY0407603.1 hypothetical protein [Virgibacillus soli]
MSVLSFYQAAMIAEKMGVMGQSTIGDAMLSVLSLILLGKAYFYPSSKKPMKKRGMVLTLVNGNNQIK